MKPRTDNATLAAAMRILSRDIQSADGVANAAIAEAAQRLEDQDRLLRDISAECKPLALLPAPLQRRIDAEIGGKA